MTSRIAIIGSNSFSGASFAAHCLKEGLEVLAISRSEEPVAPLLPYKWLSEAVQARLRFVQADLNRDLPRLMTELDTFKPAWVVNFAAQGMVAQSWAAPADWYQTNVVANVRFHDALRHASWLEKYVHVGTPEVYGSTDQLIREDAPFNPSTPYAASRAACDLHLRTFLQQHKFPVVWTRSANVYGPGQQLYRIIPRTLLFLRLGRKLSLHGGGVSVRSFIHIDDVSTATLAIAQRAKSGETYHLATERFVSIRQLVEMLCLQSGAAFAANVEVGEERPGKDAAYLLDASKARSELGWAPRVELEQGISQCIEWIDTNLEVLRAQPLDYIHKG